MIKHLGYSSKLTCTHYFCDYFILYAFMSLGFWVFFYCFSFVPFFFHSAEKKMPS